MRKNPGRWLFAAWVVVIILIVAPWIQFQDHSHWARVGWIPFISRPVRLGDILLNTLMYVPFGYLHAREQRRPRLWLTAVLAFGLSMATELSQVYSHGRFPSATDVTCNVAGAVWGFRWFRPRGARG